VPAVRGSHFSSQRYIVYQCTSHTRRMPAAAGGNRKSLNDGDDAIGGKFHPGNPLMELDTLCGIRCVASLCQWQNRLGIS